LSAFREEFKLGMWLTGNTISNSWMLGVEKTSVYELKAYVENVLIRMGLPLRKIIYKPFSNDIFSAALSVESVSGKKLGVLGIVQKLLCKRFDINAEVYFAELLWSALMKENSYLKIRQSEISKFPPVRRDLALLIDKSVSFAEIEQLAYKTDKKLLKEVALFDVYEGKNLPEGKKSYAVSFTLQDEEKTLNDKQIEGLMATIQKAFEDKLGAQLR
jgi:phenylalanyl-tRNA synthetase beta chain